MTPTPAPTVLLLGATGRTGSRVLAGLTQRGAPVRAIVRASARVPPELRARPGVALIEAELLSLGDAALRDHVQGCDVIVSCLGHVLSWAGVFGPPRDLVTRAVTRVCDAVAAIAPAHPIRLVLMSSVSVHRPDRADTTRGALDRAFLGLLRAVLPPARDNQEAADTLALRPHPGLEWVVVRPDTLVAGEVSEYTLHEGLVASVFAPARSRISNVAHFMCELATDAATWERWKGRMPVLVDAAAPARASAAA